MVAFDNMFAVIVGIVSFWGLLAAVGLPLTVACLPQGRRHLALLISPVTAIAGLSSLSHLTFFAFYQPYRPMRTYGIFLAFSLTVFAATILRRSDYKAELRKIGRSTLRSWPFLIVPFLAVCLFASFFAEHGLQLLSAGEDEFGYIDTARVISLHLFTHDAQDLPWPRADHALTEIASHQLAYRPDARLGAFVLLDDLSSLFSIDLDQAFPLLVGVTIAVGVASTGLLVLQTRTLKTAIIAAQASIATSFVVVELHLQGSLSCLTSLGFRIGGLALVLWAVTLPTGWMPLLLAIVITAGWLPVYFESFGFGLILPLALATSLSSILMIRDRRRPMSLLRSMILILSVTAIHKDLIQATLSAYSNQAHQLDSATMLGKLLALFSYTGAGIFGGVLLPIVGIQSLFETSDFNSSIAPLSSSSMPALTFIITVLAACGLLTSIRRISSAVGWAIIPIALFFAAMTAGLSSSWVAAVRSAQWLMPQLLLGLSLMVFTLARPRRDIMALSGLVSASATAFWLLLIPLNVFSVIRTVYHINSNDQSTDLFVRHFDPRHAPWTILRTSVAEKCNAPVLISGFSDTPTPHMIAWGLDPLRHVVGQSISDFWTPLDFARSPALGGPHHWMLPASIVDRFAVDPIAPMRWPQTYNDLIGASRCAIVPVEGGYPIEWGERVSLFGTVTKLFPNLGDLVERDRPAFTVQGGGVEQGIDDQGPFWTLSSRLDLRPNVEKSAPVIFKVEFDGATPSVSMNNVTLTATVSQKEGKQRSVWTSYSEANSDAMIQIDVNPDTKLRAIRFYEMEPLQ